MICVGFPSNKIQDLISGGNRGVLVSVHFLVNGLGSYQKVFVQVELSVPSGVALGHSFDSNDAIR